MFSEGFLQPSDFAPSGLFLSNPFFASFLKIRTCGFDSPRKCFRAAKCEPPHQQNDWHENVDIQTLSFASGYKWLGIPEFQRTCHFIGISQLKRSANKSDAGEIPA